MHGLDSISALSLLDQKLSQSTDVVISPKEKKTIAVLIGYHPLALQLVGSLLSHHVDPPTPASIINDLKLNPLLLLNSFLFSPNKRINMLFNISYAHLSENLKQATCSLVLFPGSFDANSVLGTYSEYKNSVKTQNVSLELSKDVVKLLVTHSLLDYNEQTKRYQYHTLFKRFLVDSQCDFTSVNYLSVSNIRLYYFKQFSHHTVHFSEKYIESIKFLRSERHNIQELFFWFTHLENDVPLSLLLIIVDTVTNAIDSGYLMCEFSNAELIDILKLIMENLNIILRDFISNIIDGCRIITDLKGKKWTISDYFRAVYVKITVTFASLFF